MIKLILIFELGSMMLKVESWKLKVVIINRAPPPPPKKKKKKTFDNRRKRSYMKDEI